MLNIVESSHKLFSLFFSYSYRRWRWKPESVWICKPHRLITKLFYSWVAVPNGALENYKRGKNSAISRLGDYRHDCGSLHLQQSSPQPLPFFWGEGSRRPLFIIAAQQRLWYLNNINFVRTVGIFIKYQIKLILVDGTSLLTCWLLLKISLCILHLHSLQLRLHIIRINIKIRIQKDYSIAGSIGHLPGISFSTNNKK